jgi:signal transduction histidine kinase
VWASTGPTLYHIGTRWEFSPRRGLSPKLISLRDRRTGAELLQDGRSPDLLGRFEFEQNSLDFRFFAGSYASRRPPTYEFRIDDHPWSNLGSSSVVTLSDLREGRYSLGVRLVSRDGVPGPPITHQFAIAAPWYRAWYAYGAYALLAAALIFLLNRLSVRHARARSAALEQIVDDRTKELKATMERLRQETETSATLAERNRLAGEIHDSLEQGFTGLALQLETTASFPNCPPDVKAGLSTALNMVAFGKNELRHVVRDLHSAMLETADLESALQHMAAHMTPDPHFAHVTVRGSPRKLGSTIEHHLLRIAQEAITNAVKHAAASHLTLELTYHDDHVLLTIEDDGRGFDVEIAQLPSRGHFGLPGLRSRARTIGATLEIKSRPGAGTRISVRVALRHASAVNETRTMPVH